LKEKNMDEDQDYDAVKKWWDDLVARSVGSYDAPEWTYLWIGVKLRRWMAKNPEKANQFRTMKGWAKAISQECEDGDPLCIGFSRRRMWELLREGAWKTIVASKDRLAITQVPPFDRDIEFARFKQRTREINHQLIREASYMHLLDGATGLPN